MVSRETSDLLMPAWSASAGSTVSYFRVDTPFSTSSSIRSASGRSACNAVYAGISTSPDSPPRGRFLRSRGFVTRNCRSFNATRPACTPCQYSSRSASRRPCSFGPATFSALICRTASTVARPITSITSSIARSPFSSSSTSGISNCPSFASHSASSRRLGVDDRGAILYRSRIGGLSFLFNTRLIPQPGRSRHRPSTYAWDSLRHNSLPHGQDYSSGPGVHHGRAGGGGAVS